MLRHRITLQTLTTQNDGYGGDAETWNDYKTVWASVEPLSGRELIQAQQTQTQYSHRIRTRFFSDFTEEMRIQYKSRTFEIESIINVNERNRELEIMCTETS